MKSRMAARRPASLQGTTRGFGQRIVNFHSEIEGKKRPGLPVAPDFRQEQRTGHAARPRLKWPAARNSHSAATRQQLNRQ
jgi:hypothetical protein